MAYDTSYSSGLADMFLTRHLFSPASGLLAERLPSVSPVIHRREARGHFLLELLG